MKRYQQKMFVLEVEQMNRGLEFILRPGVTHRLKSSLSHQTSALSSFSGGPIDDM